MLLKEIKLINFKNYRELLVHFHPKLNIITGLNGSGKTNLLDAIYYLCACKSYFQTTDKALIHFEQSFFSIEAQFEKAAQSYAVSGKFTNRGKKEFECNRFIYDKLAEHIGQFPLSIITPDDIQIVKAGSEFRRKLIDHTLAQIDPHYLQNLMRYNKILLQRNTYLKQFNSQNTSPFDHDLLHSYDYQLVQFSHKIFELRSESMPKCCQLLQESYALISNNRENIDICYESDLQKGNFLQLLQNNRDKDRILKRTTLGIHCDDWDFRIGKHAMKKLGSQGQQKSFLIALKLAFYKLLHTKLEIKPLLLLDDIFDKLDAKRIEALLQIITNNHYGQVFITDADNNRLPFILEKLNLPFNHFLVEDNRLILQ